ncbi:GFA family protein [Cognatishimia sp. F0-27]|uniref:GFA family protein n=1 Tax=Cognatishimia sp. F0-27 TaxID=2816855 RepID=UPI001D0C6154|nr:GFA family protein [Cognatishimia sp. F0-27]MCC1494776.1 GFA family protein [Cognatishimia sp. F0-27]
MAADGTTLEGRCLCGAVTVTARAATQPRLHACHCAMCRRHTSGLFVSIETEAPEITGPARSFQSSDWAERGFCGTCGSTLWYGTRADGVRHLAAGLFEDAGHGRMEIEFFADCCPSGYALAGTHRKMSTAETQAFFGVQP